MSRSLSLALTRRAGLAALALLVSAPVLAQPILGVDCPPGSVGSLGITTTDLCKARVLEFETRLQELGNKLCTKNRSTLAQAVEMARAEHVAVEPFRTVVDDLLLEGTVAREFGAIATDCGDAFLASESALTQSYLYNWITGPSEGWSSSLTVHGALIPESLRLYRETLTSAWQPGLPVDKLPGWYKNEAAYAEAIASIVAASRELLLVGQSNELGAILNTYKQHTGLTDTDETVIFLGKLVASAAIGPSPELLAEYAKNPPLRLTGANGFYTDACNAKAAKDDALADALALAWSGHLNLNGPGQLEAMQARVDALKPSFSDWSRAEPVFGSEMTGAFMSNYVKNHYFATDTNVADPSAAMVRALADAANGPAREKFGLPKIVSSEKAGDALGMAGTKFDSNDNLRVIFPGKCELDSIRGVKGDGATGDIITDLDWDPRGLYDVDSFATNKDYAISELALREPSTVNKDRARSYDVVLKCSDRTRRFRMNLPPRGNSTDAITFIKTETAPPHEDLLADGKLNGLMVGGHHTREGEVMVDALTDIGFEEVSRKNDVSVRDRFYELLEEKGADGKPTLDYFVKDAHANGYAFDAGMFRANKRGFEVVMQKVGPDGKPHRITVLGNKPGEGHDSPDGFEEVDYTKFFDVMAKRGDHHLFVGNFSCWSDGKTAFELDGIRNPKVKYVPTDVMATYYEEYYDEISSEEMTFQLVRALDAKMDYATMRTTFPTFDDEILMPDDPTFVTKISDKIRSKRAGDGNGIPVTIGLEDTQPNS